MERTYPVLGHSMRFLLEPGDAAVVRPCAPEEPRPGDLALLVKWSGGLPSGYVLHRVLFNASAGGKRLLLSKGDANFLPDWPPSAYEPAGLAVALERGGLRYRLERRLPGALLLPLYGAAVNKILYLGAACAAVLFSAARPLLPSWLLNPLYLLWEASLYPALLRLAALPARLRGGAPAAGVCAVKSGRITTDETWSGRVVVADYLTIAAGARVTALPGTEIVFERREPWFFPVLRAGLDGEARSLERAGAKMLVYGVFHAAGTAAAPVLVGGPAFSGIYALGSGRLTLSHARLSGSAACAFSARDAASVLAQGCAVSGGLRGAELYGAAGATLEHCSFTDLTGPALLAGDHAVLLVCGGLADRCGGSAVELSGQAAAGFIKFSASGCAFSDGGSALYLSGHAALSASGCVIAGNHEGAQLAGQARVRLYRCRFENNAGAPLRFSGRARAAAEGCDFTGNGSGTALSGLAALEAAGCSFSGNAGPSFELSGASRLFAFSCRSEGKHAALAAGGSAGVSLERFSADCSGAPAVSLAGGARLRAVGSAFTSSSDAVYARGAAFLTLRGCELKAGEGAALDIGCRSAELRGVQASGAGGLLTSGAAELRAEDLQITARDYAAALSGLSLYASGLRSAGGAKGGLRAAAGRVTLLGARIDGAPYPGLEAAHGAVLLAVDVFVNGERWAPSAARPAPSRARALLFRFAAATAGMPPLAWVYRLYYLAAARAAAVLLRPGRGASLYLYRGMAAGGWVAGLSDMDLALLAAPAAPAEDWAAWRALRRRLRLFRALFPFTGEVLSAPAAHFSAFMSAWGVKGAEFSSASRLLAGPGIRPEPAGGAAAADLTEAFYAYTLLLSHFYAAGLPPAFRARNCLKGMVDVRRYLDTASPARGSRRDYARSIGADLSAPGDPAAAAFEAFAALHAACPASPEAPGAVAPANPAWFNTHVFENSCAALAREAGPGTGVVLDSLYRVYVLLPDALAGDKAAFLKAASAYGAARRATHYFSAAPLLLSRSSFLALAGLPYLNNPLFWQDLLVPAAGSSPEDGGLFLYGAPRPQAPGKNAAAAAARLAAAHFSASWRSLWGSMPAHYFYTRAAGLRLVLSAGAAPAFSRPHELGEAYRAQFGGGPSWQDFRAGGACGANYEFVAAQTAAMMEGA
ncbi:MAG: right-handed parallel beta-helix repeat-containing protein [Elusimicrobiales bacterium]